jgi:hypothetical protein
MKNNDLQITRNQHIVPQRHLKNFLASGVTKLECFNIDNLRIEKPQSTKSICSADFHYALKPGEYDDYSQMVEKAFGDIEDWYAKNVDRIEYQLIKCEKLSDEDRYGLSWVIANFYFRGYKHRKEINKLSLELAEWAFPKDKDIEKIASKTSYATNASFDGGHANTLTHKHWKILINKSSVCPFITADEAVIEIFNSQFPENFPFRGSFLHQTQIFHLSPRIAIIILFPFTEEVRGVMEFLDVTNNEPGIAGNNLQYINFAHKYAYAPNTHFFQEVIDFNKKK